MAILVRTGRSSGGASGSGLERKLYGRTEPQSEYVSPEEEAEVLAKMFANPLKSEPPQRKTDEVLARWYGP
jgi:hypothetical protein